MSDIVIDQLTAHDRPAVAFTFRRLGKLSRYHRFHGVKTELASRELEYLTVVDHWHHEALIARSTHPRAPVGIGRYVRGEDFDVAEVAIEIVDSWQRRGVGRALMLALRERALASGIEFFTATMLAENRGAVALVKGLGHTRVLSASGGVKQFEIDLRCGHPRSRSVIVGSAKAAFHAPRRRPHALRSRPCRPQTIA